MSIKTSVIAEIKESKDIRYKLAVALKCSITSVDRYLASNDSKLMEDSSLIVLAEALNCQPDELIELPALPNNSKTAA